MKQMNLYTENKMKKIVAVIIIATLSLSGCSALSNKMFSTNREVTTEMETINKKEYNLLCELYHEGFERNAIDSGELFEHQKSVLKEMRAVSKYLSKKYPDLNFEIKKIVSGSYASAKYIFQFGITTETDIYTAVVDSDGVVTDDYYVAVIKSGYDSALKDLLFSSGIQPIAVDTVFSSRCGLSINGSLTGKDLFSIGNKLPRHTNIFIKAENADTELNKVRNIIEQTKIYGSYSVYCSEYFLVGFDAKLCDEIRKNNKSDIASISFRYGF